MASKTPRAAGTRAATTASAAAAAAGRAEGAADAALTYTQDQLQALIALADVMFKGAEEMRRCQMQAAHEARLRHEKAQAEVAHASSAGDLLGVQNELMRFDLEAAGKYWQQLASIVASAQSEAMNLLTRSLAQLNADAGRLAAQPMPQMQMPQMPGMPRAPEAVRGESPSAAAIDPTQAWNRWMEMSKQWTEMLYRSDGALH